MSKPISQLTSTNKPDFKELDPGPGSPISPLTARPTISTSSSSSGSVSGRPGNGPDGSVSGRTGNASDSGRTGNGSVSGRHGNVPDSGRTGNGSVMGRPVSNSCRSGNVLNSGRPGNGSGPGRPGTRLSDSGELSVNSWPTFSVSGRPGNGLDGSVSSRPGNGADSGRPGDGSGSGRPGIRLSDSGELSVNSSTTFSVSGSRVVNSGSARSESGSATSPTVNVLPVGNICGSGRVLKTGMMSNRSSRPGVLSLGSGNYGHGSIMRGGSGSRSGSGSGSVSGSVDGEELKRLGNEEYKKGCFLEALSLYDRAIYLSPVNAAYHCNRAAALIGLKRLSEAVRECDEAIRLDGGYVRAHHRLGSLLVR